MKILYLTLESYQNQPIIQSQVINLFKSICSKQAINPSFHIRLITFDNIETSAKELEHPGIKGLSHVIYKNRGMLFNLLFTIFKLNSIIKDTAIIHVRSYLPMIPALIAKIFYRRKVIFDMRGLLPEETLLRKKSRLQYKMLYILERLACRYADKIVVVSNSFKDIVLRRSKGAAKQVEIIPTFSISSGTSTSASTEIPNLRADIFKSQEIVIFVYSGAYEKWQCSEQVIHFFKSAHAKLKNARFVILSRNTEEFGTLMKNAFPEDLFYVKNAANNDLVHYLQQCNYGLLFRERNLINLVAAPIKFKDYLSAGIPVIITEGIGDYTQFVHEYSLGYVLEDLKESDFEKLLDDLSGNSKKFDSQKIARAAKELFDVEKAAKKYIALYNELK